MNILFTLRQFVGSFPWTLSLVAFYFVGLVPPVRGQLATWKAGIAKGQEAGQQCDAGYSEREGI